MRRDEFEARCIREGGIRPIDTLTRSGEVARQERELAEQCIVAAEILLGTRAELRAVGLAYFAMEHKANEFLARNRWEAKTHGCTAAGVEHLVGRPDLSARLTRFYRKRLKYDYTHDASTPITGKDLQALVDEAKAFMAAVDATLPE